MAQIHDDLARYYRADQPPQIGSRTLSLALLVLDRDDWTRLQVAENEHGSYDIVIRVDGGYGREDAERVLRDHAIQAARLAFGDAAVPPQIERDDA